MAKYQNPQMIDDALNYLKNNATRVTLCSAQPTTYAEGITTYALGTVASASGNFTIGAGDVSGRKITYGPGTIVVGTAGNVTHIALLATAGSGTLLFAGTCASTAVSAAGTVVLSAWDVEEILAIS
jgi:hypothetical protein